MAHISDVHLIERHPESRDLWRWLRLCALRLGRSLDWSAPKEKLLRALWRAKAAGADHVVITGDLTEDGHDSQFEMLAEALFEAPFCPSHITLVAGNHDAYDSGDAFSRALQGPLVAFAKTSTPGRVVDLGTVLLMPLSTAFHQPIVRASGYLGREQVDKAHSIARRISPQNSVVFALHHAPIDPPWSWNWLVGLLDQHHVRPILKQFPNTYTLSGHTHRAATHLIGECERVFVAPGVVDCENPVRFYELTDAGFCAVESHEGHVLAHTRLRANEALRA